MIESLGKLLPFKARLTPERKANLLQLRSDLEIRRWELSEEIETIQKRIDKIDEELGNEYQ